jgi:hypothetical protein
MLLLWAMPLNDEDNVMKKDLEIWCCLMAV